MEPNKPNMADVLAPNLMEIAPSESNSPMPTESQICETIQNLIHQINLLNPRIKYIKELIEVEKKNPLKRDPRPTMELQTEKGTLETELERLT
ncbi:hypothetical protein NPIL_257841, partial [Nephila pilipes]